MSKFNIKQDLKYITLQAKSKKELDKLIRERLNNPRDKLKVELYGDYFKDDENYFQIIIKYKNQRK